MRSVRDVIRVYTLHTVDGDTMRMTAAGRAMLERAQQGETLTFKGVWIGRGILPAGESADELTDLIEPIGPVALKTLTNEGETWTLEAQYTYSDFIHFAFRARELGLFANTSSDSSYRLIAYVNYGDAAPTIHLTDNQYVQTVRLTMELPGCTNVTADI